MEPERLVRDDEDGCGYATAILHHEPQQLFVYGFLGARVDGDGLDTPSKPLGDLFMPVLREVAR